MRILVIGAGPTGVHFSLSALEKGHQVTMIDVGNARPPVALPAANFLGLKRDLPDPIAYFNGEDYTGITLPAASPGDYAAYYGLPPSKDYVFDRPSRFRFSNDNFAPVLSFAAGGLAEAWTTGSYPFNEDELAAFPFSYTDIEPFYSEIARRIGVAGEEDDLARAYPRHNNLAKPTNLDTSGRHLLAQYERKRRKYNGSAVLGRSRQAILTEARPGRSACTYCGRCLWGCPNGALYTPSYTLRECMTHANFHYVPGYFVSHFELTQSGEIESAHAYQLAGGAAEKFDADAYILAAGAVSTSNIVLRTQYKSRGEIVRLEGLMDNRQVFAPFFNLAMLGKSYDPDSYQYHQLAFGLFRDEPERYVHGQVTTLKTASAHPVIQNLPVDLKTAAQVFRTVRSGLGVANLNFCDTRRVGNYLTLFDDGEEWPVLTARYRSDEREPTEMSSALKQAGRFFADLGAPFVPGMTQIRPMGSGIHYTGTLPMSAEKASWSVSPSGQSYDFPNLFVVDGATFPFLPAKNLTFTLMANAARIAAKAF
ncbi:MAG: GMC oxidoreductase [Caulobacterales bacterium]